MGKLENIMRKKLLPWWGHVMEEDRIPNKKTE